MTETVLKTDDALVPVTEDDLTLLAEAGGELVARHCPSEEELIEHGREAAALLVVYEPVTARVLAGLSRCRLVVKVGIVVDNIDLDAAREAGVAVANVPDYCLDEVSDHALALLLALARRLVPLQRAALEGIWDTPAVAGPLPRLRGQTLGLVGFGRIARALAAKATPIGLRIVAHDPYVSDDVVAAAGARSVSLETLLAESDWVSLHVPLNTETHHLLDRERLRAMRPGAFVLNVSRGGLVDEDALAEELRAGRVGGAGLDVFEVEPAPPDHPLLALPNVLATSHAAYYSVESLAELGHRGFAEAARALRGEPARNVVNE